MYIYIRIYVYNTIQYIYICAYTQVKHHPLSFQSRNSVPETSRPFPLRGVSLDPLGSLQGKGPWQTLSIRCNDSRSMSSLEYATICICIRVFTYIYIYLHRYDCIWLWLIVYDCIRLYMLVYACICLYMYYTYIALCQQVCLYTFELKKSRKRQQHDPSVLGGPSQLVTGCWLWLADSLISVISFRIVFFTPHPDQWCDDPPMDPRKRPWQNSVCWLAKLQVLNLASGWLFSTGNDCLSTQCAHYIYCAHDT